MFRGSRTRPCVTKKIVLKFKSIVMWTTNNLFRKYIITGLPVRPSHKLGFRSSAAKNGHPGEGRHEGLVRRDDVLTNGFI